MRLWLEQKKGLSEERSSTLLRLPRIHCSTDQRKRLEKMAQSRSLGIWRIKKAKVILEAIESKHLGSLMVASQFS